MSQKSKKYASSNNKIRKNIIRLYELGWKLEDIMSELNLTRYMVTNTIKQAGLRRNHDWTDEEIQQVMSLVSKGLSTHQIAKVMDKTPNQVACTRYYYGITRKKYLK